MSPPPTPKYVPEEEVHKKEKDEEDDDSTGSGTNFSYSSEDPAEKELTRRALRKANKHLRNHLRFIEMNKYPMSAVPTTNNLVQSGVTMVLYLPSYSRLY
jgi:hypothetical protein